MDTKVSMQQFLILFRGVLPLLSFNNFCFNVIEMHELNLFNNLSQMLV